MDKMKGTFRGTAIMECTDTGAHAEGLKLHRAKVSEESCTTTTQFTFNRWPRKRLGASDVLVRC